jgi:hypothetical protein
VITSSGRVSYDAYRAWVPEVKASLKQIIYYGGSSLVKFEMNAKIRVWLLLLATTLSIAAVTGKPDLKKPELLESIVLIVFCLIDDCQ